MVPSGVEVHLRVHVTGIERSLSRSSAGWNLLTETGASDGRESVMSRQSEGEGMASVGRSGGCVDYLDYRSAIAATSEDSPSFG